MSYVRCALLAVLVAALLVAAAGQGGPLKAKPQLMDIPYIQCQVCEMLAKSAWRQVKEVMRDDTPANKVDEMKIIEHMEKITTAWRPEGEWIAKLDLVEQGDRLVVREMDQVGRCGVECKTVEKAAERIMGEHDTDIAEVLYSGKKTRAQFNNWLCYELTGVCKHKPPPLPKNRPPGPPFEPLPAGEQNLERMMGEMEDQGMRGSLYSRDDLMAKYGLPEVHGEDEGEDGRPDRAEEFDGEPIDWHHIEGSKTYTTRTPMRRVIDQAKQAAQAAKSGFKAAADIAQGAWSRMRSEQKGKQEL